MDDGRREKGSGLQMSIHLLYNESNNMGFTYQNPFFHFYWHSPTVYKKYYEGRSVHIIKRNKNNSQEPKFFKKYQGKKKVYI